MSDAGATFTRLQARDLAPIAVVAQCLDNQWVSGELLDRMLIRGLSFEDAWVDRRRHSDARAEYLRALLNAEQVIINRGFLTNNPVVYQDFAKAGPERVAFTELLGDRAVVPYLMRETTPGGEQPYSVDSKGWEAWRQILQETELHCVRLSWDDDENTATTRRLLFRHFQQSLIRMGGLDRDGLRNDFNLPDEAVDEFKEILYDVANWAMRDESVTREKFYRRYVTADGTSPALGRYDGDKPFAGELKQLIDLSYNVNLPDALDRYPLTPADSLHRTALQEERLLDRHVATTTADELAATLLRRRAFDLVQRPLSVTLTGLRLSHVRAARRSPEWHRYIAALRAVTERPEEFDTLAQEVYDAYLALARTVATLVGDRHAATGPEWLPVLRVIIEVLGATISVTYGADPVVELAGQVAEEVATRSATVVVRLVVTSLDRSRARNQLATGIDIMRRRLTSTRDDWEELIARFREAGFRITVAGDDVEDDPAINGRDPDGDAE